MARNIITFNGMEICQGCLERAEDCYCSPTPRQPDEQEQFWIDEGQQDYDYEAHLSRQAMVDLATGIIR